MEPAASALAGDGLAPARGGISGTAPTGVGLTPKTPVCSWFGPPTTTSEWHSASWTYPEIEGLPAIRGTSNRETRSNGGGRKSDQTNRRGGGMKQKNLLSIGTTCRATTSEAHHSAAPAASPRCPAGRSRKVPTACAPRT